MRANITRKLLAELKTPPDGKRNQVIFDSLIPGFVVDIRPTTQTFQFRYKVESLSRLIKLGRHGSDLTVDQARRRARELRGEVALGRDPHGERTAARHGQTYGQFLEDRFLPHQRARNKGYREAERLMRRRVIPTLGKRLLSGIGAGDIQRLYDSMINEGLAPATANRALAGIKRSLTLAVTWGELDRNPATAVKAMKENNNLERFLSPAEIKALIQALDSDHHLIAVAAVKMLLLSGARRGEVLSARWQDVDLGRRLWVVPNPKGGRAHHRPLSWAAVEVLQSLPRRPDDPRVFSGGAPGRPLSLRALWERVRRAAGLNNVRLHDLRHTFASIAVGGGVPLYTVRQLLGHASSTTTERYAHLAPGHLAGANDLVTAAVLGLAQGAAPTNHPDSH